MKGRCKTIMFAAFVLAFLLNAQTQLFAELIEPTRTVEGKQEGPGRLTVLSEPPGLEITLDGNNLGKTPVFLVEVDAGTHTLNVQNSKTQIHIQSGKILKISLHRDKFIFIPVAEKTPDERPAIEQNRVIREPKITRPRDPIRKQSDADRRKATERFQQFTDGTKEFF